MHTCSRYTVEHLDLINAVESSCRSDEALARANLLRARRFLHRLIKADATWAFRPDASVDSSMSSSLYARYVPQSQQHQSRAVDTSKERRASALQTNPRHENPQKRRRIATNTDRGTFGQINELERHDALTSRDAQTSVATKRQANHNEANAQSFTQPKRRNEHVEQQPGQSPGNFNILNKFHASTASKTSASDVAVEVLPEKPVGQFDLETTIRAGPSLVYEHVVTHLPAWLDQPTCIVGSSTSSFDNLFAPAMVKRLERHGIRTPLPIQSGVLPVLLPGPDQHPGDVCISASTGAGKTLTYVLPIIESLKACFSNRIRAIVVVPTRELVSQAHDVFKTYAEGSNLRVGSAVGTQAFSEEQARLVRIVQDFAPIKSPKTCDQDMWTEQDRLYLPFAHIIHDSLPFHTTAYESRVDILVCTPGRLVDHIMRTPGFNLELLEWLVIDEADRLLEDGFQEWATCVQEALETTTEAGNRLRHNSSRRQFRIPRKVLLSATMTRNIDRLASLNLNGPILLKLTQAHSLEQSEVSKVSQLPEGLFEFALHCTSNAEKPLSFVRLIQRLLSGSPSAFDPAVTQTVEQLFPASESGHPSSKSSNAEAHSRAQSVLVFAESNESAKRLAVLLDKMTPQFRVATLTSSSTASQRSKMIAKVQSGAVRIIVATERAARGLDLFDLSHVVNYDIADTITSHVHRIGRTARAGRLGYAWNIFDERQARWFWKEIAHSSLIVRSKSVVKVKFALPADNTMHESYNSALGVLERLVKGDGPG